MIDEPFQSYVSNCIGCVVSTCSQEHLYLVIIDLWYQGVSRKTRCETPAHTVQQTDKERCRLITIVSKGVAIIGESLSGHWWEGSVDHTLRDMTYQSIIFLRWSYDSYCKRRIMPSSGSDYQGLRSVINYCVYSTIRLYPVLFSQTRGSGSRRRNNLSLRIRRILFTGSSRASALSGGGGRSRAIGAADTWQPDQRSAPGASWTD